MIAFYAWTDTLLINAMRVKETDYSDEEADLYVLVLDRISGELLDRIERSGIFAQVFRIIDPKPMFSPLLNKATKLAQGERYYRALRSQVADSADRSYRAFFTGAFWAYSLFFYRMFRQVNPEIDFCFYEEGVASYDGLKSLLRCDPLSAERSELFRLFYYRDSFGQASRRLWSIYLYSPTALLHAGNMDVRLIRRGLPRSDALLNSYIDTLRFEAYKKRDILFFLQPESEASMRVTLQNVSEAAACFGADRIAVKTHPVLPENAYPFAFPEGVYIEQDSFPFDAILEKIDWSKKLLIAKGTSCVFQPFYTCRQEPFVLFTYDMYSADPARDIPARLAERMKELYTDKTRILVSPDRESFTRLLAAYRQRNM